MSKFKVGDKVRVLMVDTLDKKHGVEIGDIVTVDEYDDTPYCTTKKGRHAFKECQLELVTEDRTTWHPHHDEIVAWAKGAKIRGRRCGAKEWDEDMTFIGWRLDWEYEVMPEPDHSAEIAEIEQEMRKLADRLEKLK